MPSRKSSPKAVFQSIATYSTFSLPHAPFPPDSNRFHDFLAERTVFTVFGLRQPCPMKFSPAKSYVTPESRFSIYCYRIHVFFAERTPFTVFGLRQPCPTKFSCAKA